MNQQRLLMKMLRTKQQTLDFDSPNIFQQLSMAQQRACQAAIADLIFQVAIATQDNPPHISTGNERDE
jgi:hypothetical protein